MAKSPTLSQQVAELAAVAAREFPLIQYRLNELKADIEQLEQRMDRLESRQNASDQRDTSIEQRCTAFEKLSDRSWQGWLALIAAGLAILVAFLKN